MMNDDELRERFRTLARHESNAASPFYSEEVAVRRALERRKREHKQHYPLFSLKRLVTAAALTITLALVLALGLAWGTNTGYASGLVISQHERNQLATNAIDISGQLSNLRTEIAQARNTMAGEKTGATAQKLLISSTSQLQQIEDALRHIESELSVTRTADTALVASTVFPVKHALAVTCRALALSPDTLPPVERSRLPGSK
ncbi:MAG: hypothetical protein ABJB74_23450 [Gemmatimonas sp.]